MQNWFQNPDRWHRCHLLFLHWYICKNLSPSDLIHFKSESPFTMIYFNVSLITPREEFHFKLMECWFTIRVEAYHWCFFLQLESRRSLLSMDSRCTTDSFSVDVIVVVAVVVVVNVLFCLILDVPLLAWLTVVVFFPAWILTYHVLFPFTVGVFSARF